MYFPNSNRYCEMKYNRCGKSGLKLPIVSLGMWHNFGGFTLYENSRVMMRKAFDLGITHFDLANNYGPPVGAAEENFGRIFTQDFKSYRDELVVSTKAGFNMWDGPYGDWGSKKHLLASLDQSLKRMNLDYVDVFYHHRPDPETPLEETMAVLDLIVRQGKALYIGISNYGVEESKEAIRILKKLGTPCLIHQMSYSLFNRCVENELLALLKEEGVGSIAYSPLGKGLLTDRYLNGIPVDSRAASNSSALNPEDVTPEKVAKVKKLNELAASRGQSLAQLALAWVLRDGRINSVIVGASKVKQIEDCVGVVNGLGFSEEELNVIEQICA